jgi:F420H(2)-dependent quinone reductase
MTDTARDAAFFRDHDKGVVEEFHANGGNEGGIFQGRDLLLLTTTGSKTGLQRVSPLFELQQVTRQDDGRCVDVQPRLGPAT